MQNLCDISVKTMKSPGGVRYLVSVQFTDLCNGSPAVRRQSSFFNSLSAFTRRMEQARIPKEKMDELVQAVNAALAVRNEVITVKDVFMDSDQMQRFGFNTLAASSRKMVRKTDVFTGFLA